jgi:hypothetical protein
MIGAFEAVPGRRFVFAVAAGGLGAVGQFAVVPIADLPSQEHLLFRQQVSQEHIQHSSARSW